MMARMTARYLSLLLIAALALTVGCADDKALTSNSDSRENHNGGTPNNLDGDSQLLHYGACDSEDVSCPRPGQVGANMDLPVQLVTADGDPVEYATIKYDLVRIQGASGVDLSAKRGATDSDGVATTTLQIPEDPSEALGSLEITVSVEDDSSINELIFNVGISAKDAASYVIEFEHLGQSRPDRVRPLLLDPEIDCDVARSDFFDTGNWPSAEYQLPHANVNPDGSVNNAILHNVNNDTAYTVVGVAEEQVGNQYVDVAYGCVDTAEPVTDGVNVYVEVPLNDHIPHLGERYDMTHDFNLVGALPDSVQAIIEIISTLVNDPASFILGCPEENESACPDGGQVGLVDMIMDFDFISDSLADQIDDIRESFAFGAALGWLDGFLTDLLPDWAQDTFVATGDIISMLEEFTVLGRMYFEEQPVPELLNGEAVGLLYAENSYQYWDDLVFTWSLPCDEADLPEDCARVKIGANDLGQGGSNTIEGYFNATVYGSDAIEIDSHPMTLHYGKLLVAVIEQVILPELFPNEDNPDPPVDSLDGLIGQLIDCQSLAEELSSNPDLQNAAASMCNQLAGQATDAIYAWVEDTLVADGDDHFRIGTPSGVPCTIHQPSTYPGSNWPGAPLPYIDTLGDPGNDLRCEWNTEINYSGDAEPDAVVTGHFDGELAD